MLPSPPVKNDWTPSYDESTIDLNWWSQDSIYHQFWRFANNTLRSGSAVPFLKTLQNIWEPWPLLKCSILQKTWSMHIPDDVDFTIPKKTSSIWQESWHRTQTYITKTSLLGSFFYYFLWNKRKFPERRLVFSFLNEFRNILLIFKVLIAHFPNITVKRRTKNEPRLCCA